MFNLLPEPYKKKMRREYIIRLCVVALCFSFGIFLIASVFLLPSYFLSSIKERELMSRLSNEKASLPSDATVRPETVVQKTNADLALLKNNGSVSFVGLVSKVLARKPVGIKIEGLTISQNTPTHQISISGTARLREDLVTFKKSLEDEPLFVKVELPVSSLAKSSDINFTVTVTGNF